MAQWLEGKGGNLIPKDDAQDMNPRAPRSVDPLGKKRPRDESRDENRWREHRERQDDPSPKPPSWALQGERPGSLDPSLPAAKGEQPTASPLSPSEQPTEEEVMPAKSKAQQKAAGAALAAKRGEITKSELRGASRAMVESMTEKELEEMASTSRKGKPEHVAKKR
jgi:hypothetical protein